MLCLLIFPILAIFEFKELIRSFVLLIDQADFFAVDQKIFRKKQAIIVN